MFANAMPAAYPERNLLGCKWISVVPDNPLRGLPTASGVMVVNDGTTGMPRALLPAAELTAVRTAAVTGACIRALADDDGPVAYLGAGVQAASHLRILEALGHTEVHVWARRHQAIDAPVSETAKAARGIRVIASPSREAAGPRQGRRDHRAVDRSHRHGHPGDLVACGRAAPADRLRQLGRPTSPTSSSPAPSPTAPKRQELVSSSTSEPPTMAR